MFLTFAPTDVDSDRRLFFSFFLLYHPPVFFDIATAFSKIQSENGVLHNRW
jgi:hypothetical protein